LRGVGMAADCCKHFSFIVIWVLHWICARSKVVDKDAQRPDLCCPSC
jgi:hypothetical protein